MQFIPNSPRPPKGTICSFPDDMEYLMLAQARSKLVEGRPRPRAVTAQELCRNQRANLIMVLYSIFRATMNSVSIEPTMSQDRKSWLRQRIEQGLIHGITHAYDTVKVNPAKFLIQMRAAYSLPITRFRGVSTVELGYLDEVANSVVRSSVKMAAVQGAGFGLGGLLTVVPDLGFLSALTMRTIQKLSLVYGFESNTEDEMAELWVAAASAAGVDISRELVEK